MAKILLEIPDYIQQAMDLPPEEAEREIRKEVALALYRREILSVGKASEFAGMNRWDFEDLLGERDILRQYGQEELAEDIDYAWNR